MLAMPVLAKPQVSRMPLIGYAMHIADRVARGLTPFPLLCTHGVSWSRRLLFQPIFMMQASKDRTGYYLQMLRKPVPVRLPWHWE
jgi:hypothetical protein